MRNQKVYKHKNTCTTEVSDYLTMQDTSVNTNSYLLHVVVICINHNKLPCKTDIVKSLFLHENPIFMSPQTKQKNLWDFTEKMDLTKSTLQGSFIVNESWSLWWVAHAASKLVSYIVYMKSYERENFHGYIVWQCSYIMCGNFHISSIIFHIS